MSALVPSVWQTNGGLYHGYGVNSTEWPPVIGDVLRYTGDRHVCFVGNSGSGKSRRWLAVNLALLTGWSVVVIGATLHAGLSLPCISSEMATDYTE